MSSSAKHKTRAGPEWLCGERAHCEFVAGLALRLFDDLQEELGLAASDRKLLAAAALAHDDGYRIDPGNHAAAGAALFIQKARRRFTAQQRTACAAAILLHSGAPGKRMDDPLLADTAVRRRAMRLAAFLRLADGLDRARLQTARIKSVRMKRGRIVVRLKNDRYPAAAAHAAARADLWNAVFPVPIVFDQGPLRGSRAKHFSGVVRRGETALAALCRIMNLQRRLVADSVPGVIGGTSAEPLHNMRVAIRRLRIALGAVGRLTGNARAMRLKASFDRLFRELGPARDIQVWLEFLREKERAGGKRPTGWTAYVSREKAVARGELAKARRILSGTLYARAMRESAVFLRITLPDLAAGRNKDVSFADFAAQRLWKLRQRILVNRDSRLDPDKMTAAALHELRCDCRRLRYWAEFAAPVLDFKADKLIDGLLGVTGALGRLNDMNVNLRRLARARAKPPKEVLNRAEQVRIGAMHDFRRAWRKAARIASRSM